MKEICDKGDQTVFVNEKTSTSGGGLYQKLENEMYENYCLLHYLIINLIMTLFTCVYRLEMIVLTPYLAASEVLLLIVS